MSKTPQAGRTPARFRALRTACGISRSDLARILEVAPRTVRAWDYKAIAPAAAWCIVEAQAQRVTEEVDAALELLDEATEGRPAPERVELVAYVNDTSAKAAGLDIPATWHCATIGHIAMAMEAEGHTVSIVYAVQEAEG